MLQTIQAVGLAAVASALPTAGYVLVLWWCDRYEKEPLWLLTLAFLWGALPAVAVSLIVELALRLPSAALGGLSLLIDSGAVAPVVEEVAKGAALLAIYWRHRAEFDGVLDGIIYGAVVGFGFAMTENALYFIAELAEGSLGSFGLLWLLRAVVFGLNHALFSAIFGAGLGLARLSRQAWQRWLVPLLAFAVAVGLHASHNLFTGLAGELCWPALISLAGDWGGLAVILVVVWLSWRQERRWLTTQLWEEVGRGVITAAEYTALASAWQRRALFWAALSAHGWGAAWAWRRRVGWATELAFKKHQLATAGSAAGEAGEIERLRALLRGSG